MNRDLYTDYLNSAEWTARREKVMQRAGGICEGCRQRPATEVHHLSYEHVTQEFLFELVAICGDCHARWHGQPARPKADWTPRHTGHVQEKPSPGAQARRGQLSQLAAQKRAEFMAAPLPEPSSSTGAQVADLARMFHEGQAKDDGTDIPEGEAA